MVTVLSPIFTASRMCVIQTTEIRHLPFDEVDAQFAFDEGEGDQSLEYWRAGASAIISHVKRAELGIDFDELRSFAASGLDFCFRNELQTSHTIRRHRFSRLAGAGE